MNIFDKLISYFFNRAYKIGFAAASLGNTEPLGTAGSITTKDTREKQLIMEHRAKEAGFLYCKKCGKSTALKYQMKRGDEFRKITLVNVNGLMLCTECAKHFSIKLQGENTLEG